MKIKKFCSSLSFNTEDIEFTDFSTLGIVGNYGYRCKAELKREFDEDKPKQVSIKVGYCFGKTLNQLEKNCIQEITEAWEKHHAGNTARTYADVMWM